MSSYLNTVLGFLFLVLQLINPSTAKASNNDLNILDHNIILVNTNATVPKKEQTNFETINPIKGYKNR